MMISGSSLELRASQTTPVPDYEVDPGRGEAEQSDRDVWGNVERYRSVVCRQSVTLTLILIVIFQGRSGPGPGPGPGLQAWS